MHGAEKFLSVGDRPGIINKIIGRAVRRGGLWSQRGFTLIEMLAVLSILAALVAIVAGSVGGLGSRTSEARLAGDADTIGTASDRFFTDAFPQKYPVADADTDGDGLFTIADEPPAPAGDVGVRLIDFDAVLPQDGTKKFAPDFLKEVPDSAGQVSWRVDTNSGNVFATEYGASLVLPAESDLDVKAGTTAAHRVKGTVSDYTLGLTMKKNEAATEILEVEIPAGYAIGSGSITTANMLLGELTGTLATDNDVESGQTIVFGGVLLGTTTANAMKLMVDYSNNRSTSGVEDLVIRASIAVRVHDVSILLPTATKAGKLTMTMNRSTDKDHNEATESWKLKILGTATHTLAAEDFNAGTIDSGLATGDVTLVATASTKTFTFTLATPTTDSEDKTLTTNPPTKGVYRWLAKEQTTIDLAGIFDRVSGNQAVIITDS